MIPRIIHFCWFGEAQIPVEQLMYIEEWKRKHADWQFIKWEEGNSPIHLPYMQRAKELKNWANMSNYVRLHAMKEHGGIYLDTDIKLIKELTPLLENDCFFGFEEYNPESETFWVNNALFGATKDHPFIDTCINELLTNYDGSEEANLSAPQLITGLLKREKGLTQYKEQLLDGIKLYPTEYFYPIHYSEAYKLNELESYICPETIAVHVWARTWIDKKELLGIVDFLNFKTNDQEKYIADLKKTIQALEAKADEIFYWKQHFEKEYNNLQQEKEKNETILNYQNTYSTLTEAVNQILYKAVKNEQDLSDMIVSFKESKDVNEASAQVLLKNIEKCHTELENLQQRVAEHNTAISRNNDISNSLLVTTKELITGLTSIHLHQQQLADQANKQSQQFFEELKDYKDGITDLQKNNDLKFAELSKKIEMQSIVLDDLQQELANYSKQVQNVHIGNLFLNLFRKKHH